MAFFRNSPKNLISIRTLVAIATKLNLRKIFKISLSKTIRPRVCKFVASADPDIFLRGGSHRKRTRLIIRYFDFRISMDVSLLQEKSTFPVLTMRMSPHLEPYFFFLIYDCILHTCCAISNQYHFTNPMSTFLPKFQGGSGPPVHPSGSAHVLYSLV